MDIKALGIDLGKSWFQLHGVDRRGKTVLQKKGFCRKFLGRELRD